MLELIARLEAATRPGRDLDGEIWLATRLVWTDREYHHWARNNDDISNTERDYARERAPRFTYSIDAAVLLVPDKWAWSLGFCDRENHAWVAAQDRGTDGIDGFGATPALALCIASLKARA